MIDFFSDPEKHAHPKAKNLMNDDFFWSPIIEAGPFGSDAGADAAQGFNQWRIINKTTDPVEYLRELLPSWGMPLLDWNELDPSKVSEFIHIKPSFTNDASNIDLFKDLLKNVPDGSNMQLTDKEMEGLIQKSSESMGNIYLLEMDNAIIGTGFAQFAIEGKIDTNLQYLAITALKRQLLPLLIDCYDDEYREIRRDTLLKMLDVIQKANL